MGRAPVQGVLPKCRKGFIHSEANSEQKQARGPNPCNEQEQLTCK